MALLSVSCHLIGKEASIYKKGLPNRFLRSVYRVKGVCVKDKNDCVPTQGQKAKARELIWCRIACQWKSEVCSLFLILSYFVG
jgi:hypothetical protein